MSDPTFQTKVHGNHGGDRLTVESAGTIAVISGGSIQVASGGIIQVASGGSIVNAGVTSKTGVDAVASGGTLLVQSGGSIQVAAGGMFQTAGTINLGGTVGRWAFGSATLTSGTVPISTGLSQVVSAHVTAVTASINAGTGAGTATSFQIDLSRANTGTVFALGVTGTAAFTGAGTVVFSAFGY